LYLVHKEEGVFKVEKATQMASFLGQLHLVGMNTYTNTHSVLLTGGQVVASLSWLGLKWKLSL